MVHLACAAGEEVCEQADGTPSCTAGGVCDLLGSVQEATLTVVQLAGPGIVFVAQGDAYVKCTPELPLHVICDQVCSAIRSSCCGKRDFVPQEHWG